MPSYIILKHITVQKANAIAGLTYGFPSVGSFLGFVHALSRKLASQDYSLDGVSILHHSSSIDTYQNEFHDYKFVQQKYPPHVINRSGKTEDSPIVQEAKMQLDVSLVMRINNSPYITDGVELSKCTREMVFMMRLSGGNIISIEDCVYCEDDTEMLKEVRRLQPFAALSDRSELYVNELTSDAEMDRIKTFMEFCKSEYKSEYIEKDSTGLQILKERHGENLVPCHFGYKAISEIFCNEGKDGKVHLRNGNYNGVFVEPVHSIAEWVKSPHKFQEYFKEDASKVFWKFHNEGSYYLFNSIKGGRDGKKSS